MVDKRQTVSTRLSKNRQNGLWVGQLSPSKKEEFTDVFYDEMKPILWSLRILSRFVYGVNSKGRMYVQLKCKWALYTGAMYSVQSWMAAENVVGIVGALNGSSGQVEDLLFTTTSLIFMTFHFLAAFLTWYESCRFAAYISLWRHFQENFLALLGEPIACGLKVPVMICVILLFPSVFGSVYLVSDVLFSQRWYNTLPYSVVFLQCNLYLVFWAFTCCKLCSVAAHIKKEIKKVVDEGMWSYDRVKRVRLLWLSCAELCRGLGDLAPGSILFLLNAIAYCFVASAYALLSYLAGARFNVIAFSVMLAYSFGYFFVLVESAHKATHSVGAQITMAMLRRDTTIMDEKTAYEVDVFLQAISLNQPTIQLGGFVTIDRRSCVSLLTSTITYLIVLVQFKSSEKT